jgi:hypothetical protein
MRKLFSWHRQPSKSSSKSSSHARTGAGRFRTLSFQALEPRDLKSADVVAALTAAGSTSLSNTTTADTSEAPASAPAATATAIAVTETTSPAGTTTATTAAVPPLADTGAAPTAPAPIATPTAPTETPTSPALTTLQNDAGAQTAPQNDVSASIAPKNDVGPQTAPQADVDSPTVPQGEAAVPPAAQQDEAPQVVSQPSDKVPTSLPSDVGRAVNTPTPTSAATADQPATVNPVGGSTAVSSGRYAALFADSPTGYGGVANGYVGDPGYVADSGYGGDPGYGGSLHGPTITDFTGTQEPDVWVFSGHVIDDVSPDGCTVNFGGVLHGRTAPVYSDGSFILVLYLPAGVSGTATAQLVDWQGLSSNVATFYVA